jgi:hypothetical protein
VDAQDWNAYIFTAIFSIELALKLLATDTAFLKDLLVIATPLLQTAQLPFMHEPTVLTSKSASASC